MTGGLIQLVSSGKQDGYLTYNPQITYFKRVYRRHTIFGIELMSTVPDQQPEYNNRVSFLINNISDLIGKCYIEIQIPTLSFTESPIVTSLKQNDLANLVKEMNKWSSLYTNLKNYCAIEMLLYQNLNSLLNSINITLQILKQNVLKFNSQYKKSKDALVNLILDNVYSQIDLTGYILQLNLMIVSDDYVNYNPAIEIKNSDLKANINTYYQNMIKYLKYYYSNYTYYLTQYNNLSNTNVKFSWNDHLAHVYFTDFELELGGQLVETYSLEQSLIYQMHNISPDRMDNYNKMIGVDSSLNQFNNKTKTGQTLILPLNFWFCKDIGCALPTVALANSSVAINLKLNSLKNLLYFQDYETEYYDFLIITTIKDKTIYDNLNVKSYTFDTDSQLITYTCLNINQQLFALKYPSLLPADIVTILETYGQFIDGEYIMGLSNWINYKMNYTGNQNILNPSANNDYNMYYSLVPKPQITLITESIFLDDVERNKFGSSKLEYVVEIFQENIYDIEKQMLFNAELSIDRPIKELLWITQPKLFLEGLSEYGKTYLTRFLFSEFFTSSYYSSYQISLNQIGIIKPKLDSIFYNELQSYQYYNNALLEGVSAYNFGLYPEEFQPTGTANFSIFKGKLINFVLDPTFMSEYFNTNLNPNQLGLQLKFMARGYNFLVIEKGYGKMIFSTI